MSLYLSSFLILTIIMLFYLRIANKLNIIDRPNERSSHSFPTIRGGGVIFPISIILWSMFVDDGLAPFIFGLCLISLISFLDDFYTLSNKVRVLVHLLSVGLLLYQFGFEDYNWLTYLISLVLIIGWVNAFNFMDGINGISALYAICVLTSCYCINISFYFIPPSLIEYSGMGLIIFGFYNIRTHAKTFAGDVGSVSMSFIIAFVIISLIMSSNNWQYVLFVSIYGIDTVVTIVQRLFRNENIFKAHRTHLYQYLANEAKWSHVSVSIIYALSQFALNAILIFYIIPVKSHLIAILYLALQGVFYLIIKRSLIQKLKIN